ncbi:MAG TPA: dTDP-4-dehydrorhamnose reductase [Clostridia bacterium]|nr:dTDP-4-dehydrorhamnose reductase [Clostridia bacterium]
MKILVTGYKGQLGYEVVKVLEQRGIDCLGADIEQFDITDREAVNTYVKGYRPDAVIHCSAYTAVDKAEDEEKLCEAVNAEGTRNIALVCRELDAKMIYISSDYVFPGTGNGESEVNDPIGPLNVYGITKFAGELVVREMLPKHFIVRISWLFGLNGKNFIRTMLRLGKELSEVKVVCDQIGSPTYTADIARLLCDMAVTDKYGTYHATNEGFCSWAEFAEEIFLQAGYETKVNHIPTSEYPAKARRPMNSRLSKKSLDEAGFMRLPAWKDALERYLKELKDYCNA